jgi:hypothetical protein
MDHYYYYEFEDKRKAEELFAKIIELSKADPHADALRGGITYTVYGSFTDLEDESEDGENFKEKFNRMLSRVTADHKTLKEALARFEEERSKPEPARLGLHHISIPFIAVSNLSSHKARVDKIGKEFDMKFTHSKIGISGEEKGISLTLDGLHYNSLSSLDAFKVPLCSICSHLLQKTLTDDGDYDDDGRSYHEDGATDMPAEDWQFGDK